MDSLAVIEQLNVLENLLLRLFLSFESRAVNELFLEYAVKRLDACIIVTVTLATHARCDAVLF